MARLTRLELHVPPPLDVRASATDHGWVALAPTAWLADRQVVQRVERLRTGHVVLVAISGGGTRDRTTLQVDVRHPRPLLAEEHVEMCAAVSRMFRLEEDFSAFYALCRARGAPWTRLTAGWGRLLRSPTVFEDVIKTLCTTNTRWSGTKRMVTHLVAALGEPYEGEPDLRAFPTPETMARLTLEAFSAAVPLGYRADYVHRHAREVASGVLDLEAWRDPSLPSEVVTQKLRAIKGVGPYASHTLLMLLGRYDELAIDAKMRAFVRQKYFQGNGPSDQRIRAVYDVWGRWKYLACWFDAAAGG